MTLPTIAVEIVHAVDQDAVRRAVRLQFAVRLLKDGVSRREASGRVQAHYECSQATAWRVVDMAADLVVPCRKAMRT
jgi:hypothetical protein